MLLRRDCGVEKEERGVNAERGVIPPASMVVERGVSRCDMPRVVDTEPGS